MQVEESPLAIAMFGLILRRHAGDPVMEQSLNDARNNLIIELRVAHPSVWLLPSRLHEDACELYYPPLIAHFQQARSNKIRIVDYQEIDVSGASTL